MIEQSSNNINTAATKTIIQCPGCVTKFMLTRKSLDNKSESANIKFQCSVCSEIFVHQLQDVEANIPRHATTSPDPGLITEVSSKLVEHVSVENIAANRFTITPASPESKSPRFSFTIRALPEPSDSFNSTTKFEQPKKSAFDIKLPTFNVKKYLSIFSLQSFFYFQRSLSKGLSPIMLLSSPSILASILALCIMAYSFTEPSKAVGAADIIGSMKNEILLPTDLGIEKTSIKEVVLSSGEKVQVIQGQALNSGTITYKSTHIEGMIYNASGNLIGRSTTYLGSLKQDIKLESFNAATLQKMQEKIPSKRIELNSSASESFQMVIPYSPIDGQVVYFSTRVISALKGE